MEPGALANIFGIVRAAIAVMVALSIDEDKRGDDVLYRLRLCPVAETEPDL
jgi:hypothetical protein